jgi:uncharacterized membrane protein
MNELAMYAYMLSGFAAIACWYLASVKQSKRLTWAAIALAAVAGFTLCSAISAGSTLSLLYPLSAAVLAAISLALAKWWTDYLQRQASREADKTAKPFLVAAAAVLVAAGAALTAGWIYLQKRVSRKPSMRDSHLPKGTHVNDP